ncbi:MAG: DUF2334 domain-containing protein [Janthinobacterium lividum]
MPASDAPPAPRLLVSIHDVGPRFEREIDRLADRLDRLLGGPRFAMLVVPDHWGEAPLSQSPAYRRRLRDWADAGVEMFVHGWSHRDAAPAGFRARHMTAGEGEFAALGHDEALRRMIAGRAVVEDAIGRPAAGFIAPAWLYSDGARSAMAAAGFALAEDHLRVWRPGTGTALATGPVITWASRSRARIVSSLAAARVLRILLARAAVVRVAVHPGDTGVPALMDSIDATIAALAKRHVPARYKDLHVARP